MRIRPFVVLAFFLAIILFAFATTMNTVSAMTHQTATMAPTATATQTATTTVTPREVGLAADRWNTSLTNDLLVAHDAKTVSSDATNSTAPANSAAITTMTPMATQTAIAAIASTTQTWSAGALTTKDSSETLTDVT